LAGGAALALVGGLLTVVAPLAPAQAATLNETEKNDTMATANSLPLGTTIQGHSWGTNTTYYGTVGYDDDYYRFSVSSTSKLGLSFSWPQIVGVNGTNTAYHLTILDSNNATRFYYQPTNAEYSGSWFSNFSVFLPAGTYFVDVYGDTNSNTWQNTMYSLTVTATPPPTGITYEQEFNDSNATANSLPLGSTIQGSSWGTNTTNYGTVGYDDDYYRFSVPSTSKLGLSFSWPQIIGVSGTNTAYHLTIRDSNNVTRFYYQPTNAEYSGSWFSNYSIFLPAGTYYVDVYGDTNSNTWGKTYSLKVTAAAGNYEQEFNDSIATANSLPLGSTIQGSSWGTNTTNYGTVGYDDDYYRFTVPSSMQVRAALSFAQITPTSSNHDAYNVTIYDANLNTLGSEAVSIEQFSGASLTLNLSAGTYFVKVYSDSGRAVWGKTYSLSVGAIMTGATPKITGTAAVGKVLTAVPGTWSPSSTKLSYQWLRAGVAISGATSSTYTLVAADAGKAISVKVTGTLSGYASVSKTSATVTVPVPTVVGATPTISGTVAIGNTLTAKPGTWSPSGVKLSYQWLRNGVAISGATGSTHVVVAADVGAMLTVKVTGTLTGYATVSLTSAAVSGSANCGFSDVSVTSSYAGYICWMKTSGVTTGTTPTTFSPAANVTRGQMAAFMYRLAGSPKFTPPTKPSFSDVPASSEFYKQIEWLKHTGITTGTTPTTFSPSANVTRGQMAAFMYRLAGSPTFTPPKTASFGDVPTSNEFYKQIEWLKHKDITTGTTATTYSPSANVTRQQMAAFMYRLAQGRYYCTSYKTGVNC